MARVLEALVRLSDFSVREVERRLDLGAGTLNRIFNGRIDLKLRHILRVLEVIGMRPERFFQLACAKPRVEDGGDSAATSVLESFQRLGYGRVAPPPAPSRRWTNEELDRRIEAVLDRVLDRGGPPALSDGFKAATRETLIGATTPAGTSGAAGVGPPLPLGGGKIPPQDSWPDD